MGNHTSQLHGWLLGLTIRWTLALCHYMENTLQNCHGSTNHYLFINLLAFARIWNCLIISCDYMDYYRKIMSSGHGQIAVMWSHSNYYGMYPIETQARRNSTIERRGNNFPPLDTKLLVVDSSWESERKLSLRTWSLLSWPYSTRSSTSENICAPQTRLEGNQRLRTNLDG